jgi:hypothetical protein
MLYLRHYDGFATAYAHLQRFKDSIEVYVKKLQKTSRAYSVEVDLDSALFRVAKGEVIAYSGDTGVGSAHLHFELRDSSMNAINPFLSPQFSSLLHDEVPPLFHMVAFTPLDRSSRVHGRSRAWIVNAKRGSRGEFHVDGRVILKGKIGISVRVTDQSDILKYRTSPHRFAIYLDGDQILTSAKNFIPENETHQVAAYYDRSSLLRRMGRFEKLYIESGNRLPFYNRLPEGSGLIDTSTLEPGSHELTIHAWDLAGNRSVVGVILLTGEPVRR